MTVGDTQVAADGGSAGRHPRGVDAVTARSALRLLREPAWAGLLLGVVAVSVLFVVLGRWQWSRHEDKVARNARITANYEAAPAPLTSVLRSPGTALAADLEWRPVQARGRYEPERTVLVRNRVQRGQVGYEVLVPLRTADGVLLVDRGWLPADPAAGAPAVPGPPPGVVDVVVRLRPPEPADDRRPPPGQAFRIEVPATGTAGAAGPAGAEPVYRAYGVLVREQPAPQLAPLPLERPERGLGMNQAYAVQWWGFALAAYVLLGVYAVKEVRRRDGAAPSRAAAGDLRRRSGRRELTDEEWEDAADR